MELYTLNYRNYDGDINTTRLFFEQEDALNAILEDLNEDEQLVCLNSTGEEMFFRSFVGYDRKLNRSEAWEFDYYFEFTVSCIKVEGDEAFFLSQRARETNYKGVAV